MSTFRQQYGMSYNDVRKARRREYSRSYYVKNSYKRYQTQDSYFSIDMTEVYKVLETLQDIPEQAMVAFNNALKSTKSKAVKIIAKYVSDEYDASELSFAISRYGRSKMGLVSWVIDPLSMSAAIEFTGTRLTLHRFPHAPGSRPSHRRYRVAATIKGGNTHIFGNRTFIASTGAKSSDAVQSIPFMRTGEWVKPDPTRNGKSFKLGKTPSGRNKQGLVEKIRPVYTLSVPQMVQNEQLREPIERDLGELLLKAFVKERDKMFARRVGG